MKPKPLVSLKKGELIDTQKGFVDSYNYVQSVAANFRGDGIFVEVDRSNDDVPVIGLTDRAIQLIGDGGGGGGEGEGWPGPFEYDPDNNAIENCFYYDNRTLSQLTTGTSYTTTGAGTYYLHLSHTGNQTTSEIVKDATETTPSATSSFYNDDTNTYYKLWTIYADGSAFDWRKILVVPFYER